MIMYVDKQNKFFEVFDPKDGFTMRSAVGYKKDGPDPFMRNFPGLIDIGIMGNCAHATQCTVGCYQGGTGNQKPNMKFEDYKSIIDQCKGKVFQVALGGHGDPNQHTDFGAFLYYTRMNDIVPNYTTSGLNLTDEQVRLTKELVGACAVSWYRAPYTFSALKKFIKAGCTTNIHFVLSNKSINEAIAILKNDVAGLHEVYGLDFSYINAIIFLLHKPVGCGKKEDCLDYNDPRLKEFFSLISKEHPFKIGFDSCTVPGLVNFADINFDSVDTCEGARYSMYISSDMIAVPCSFDQQKKHGCDLRTMTIQQSWDSRSFENFRDSMRNSCKGCNQREICMGGCPLEQSIVLCERNERG